LNPLPESTIKRQIMRFLRSLPESDWEVSPPGSVAGKPDIVGCLTGRYVAFETKKVGGRRRPLQVHRIKELKAAGAVTGFPRSVEEVKEILYIHCLYAWWERTD